jgi:crossover junction endonuclease MUS81
MAQQLPRQTLSTSQLDRSNELVTLPNHATFSPSVLPPGSYTVHLILDNREKRSTEDREYIPNELTKLSVPFLQRGLSLGDALWIAKPRDPASVDEYILPHICERKRLDDLISSIKDKRFHEQKFRLARCGIPPQSITYIIEEYSLSEQQKSEHTERINTAKAETQIVNGFFVKCTQKLDETIRYLALMTKSLQELYAEKPLYVIPQSHIDARTYSTFCSSLQSHPQHSDKTFTIPLSTFSDLTSKSGALNLRDLYLKMLMCTRNISGEKAIEIQRVWPTPRALIEAFESKATDKEREKMVAEGLRECVGRKKVAAVLSRKVAAVWGGVGGGVGATNSSSGNRGTEVAG